MEWLKAGEISEFTMEKRYFRKDGKIVWVILIVSPLWAPTEKPDTHIAVVHDITEQKRTEYALRYSEAEVRKLNAELEQRVAERTAQLENTNKELEAFSYSVSHDLRAPLRAIDGFSRIVLEDHASQLDGEVQKLLGHVRIESQRMAQLIEALLNLSRMGRIEMHRETVNLSSLAQMILDGLCQAQPQRQVERILANEVTGQGDTRLLYVVLENLLGNAWKFTAKRKQAKIEFGMEQRENESVYFVRDNGAGFDMAYAEKLFGAFQRLHGQHEFEGTGIGLATVQRIVSRHGGRVWAEAEVGQGATFYFTLG
jgi:light-regulated signal transduction histidine kinase (bacteriophytochrome)